MPKLPPGFGFDMSGWQKKVSAARLGLKNTIIPACVEKGMDMMNEEVTKNISGVMHAYGTPSPTPGQLPVTGITANLRGAVVSRRIDDNLGIVFIDGKASKTKGGAGNGKAPYAAAIEYGTKTADGKRTMRPRRFFRTARLTVKPKLLAFWQVQIKLIGKL
jgi:hypothetical protein